MGGLWGGDYMVARGVDKMAIGIWRKTEPAEVDSAGS